MCYNYNKSRIIPESHKIIFILFQVFPRWQNLVSNCVKFFKLWQILFQPMVSTSKCHGYPGYQNCKQPAEAATGGVL